MFPTRAKDKIPKSLTYPLKAKAVSEALADMPQADEFQLYFSNLETPPKKRRDTKFWLIQVCYYCWEANSFMPYYFAEADYENPQWAIEVHAVPIEIRARVTQLLHDEGLPKIRAWLHLKKDVSNQLSCRIDVCYNESDDKLYCSKRET